MSCECVTCPECDGFGSIWISFSGKYMGKYRCDDLDEMDTCPDCGGDGLSFCCYECAQAMEDEEEKNYIDNQKIHQASW